MVLSETEKLLYAELVAQIAVYFPKNTLDGVKWAQNQTSKGRFDFKNCVIEHGFMGDFEAACDVMHRLEILLPLNSDGSPMEDEKPPIAYFRMKYDLSEIRAILHKGLPPSAPPLSEVIESFLSLLTDYGNGVSTRRAPFRVSADLEPTFQLLAQCKYVEQDGECYSWTDKIADAMRAIYRWNKDNVSEAELYDAEIDEMWRTLPPKIRKAFFSGGPVDVVSLSIVISQCWSDGEWQDIDRDALQNNIRMRGGAIQQAKDLEKRFRDSAS